MFDPQCSQPSGTASGIRSIKNSAFNVLSTELTLTAESLQTSTSGHTIVSGALFDQQWGSISVLNLLVQWHWLNQNSAFNVLSTELTLTAESLQTSTSGHTIVSGALFDQQWGSISVLNLLVQWHWLNQKFCF